MTILIFTHFRVVIYCTCLLLITANSSLACDIRVSFADDAELFPARDFGLPTSPPLINPLRIELISQDSGCNAIIGFTTNNENNGNQYLTKGSEHIEYRLLRSPNGSSELADLPSAQIDDVLHGSVNNKRASMFHYYLVVPGHQAASPGTYRDRIDISVYNQNGGSPKLATTHTVNVSLTVRSEIDLQVLAGVGPAGSGSDVRMIDFGELQTGEQAEIRLKVTANVAVQLIITSENRGKFRHVSQPQASIPYSVQIGDLQAADMQRPVSLVALPALGSRVSFTTLTLVVGSVEYSLAGLYRDRLLVTIQAQ